MNDSNQYPENGSQGYDVEQEPKKFSRPLVLTITLVLAVVITVTGYMLYDHSVSDSPQVTKDPYEQLQDNNTYSQAEESFRNGELDTARTLYQQTLNTELDADQEGQVLYKIALTETHSNPEGAITTLKQIVNGELYSDLQKAYAVQRLGLMFYRNSDPALLPVIFSGEPYADFYREGNTALALRQLFEYSSTFYPLAISELRAAGWYADEIKQAYELDSFGNIKDQYIPVIERKIANADADIMRTSTLENAGSLIPEALFLKGVLYARLASVGLNYDYEKALQNALNTAILSGQKGADGSARYAYAMNLFLYEDGREREVRDLLAPMVTDIDSYPTFKRMFEKEKDNVLGQKDGLVRLSNSWPEFKSLLVSLGWPEVAFAGQ